MSTPSPATARVVERASEITRRLEGVFRSSGGGIDDGEQRLLDECVVLLEDAQDADDGRLAAIGLLNVGELSAWQQRRWRERHRDRRLPPAA